MAETTIAAPVDGPGIRPPAQNPQALESWLASQITMETEGVTLPESGQRYAIHKPDQQSRDRLFAEAHADPDKQMPHWAKIWPSGVALADVVLHRPAEVKGRRVLELGCGLGVTAIAALASGAKLTVADYSALPLTLCQYNSLANSGKSPSTVRFNWRSIEDGTSPLMQAEAAGGYPLILAADVLYEGRDVLPLLALFERLLAPEGMVWLAEPRRKTAQRFMNVAASQGWESTSQSTFGPWPDGTKDGVNVHFLRRATFVDELPADLGGWRG